MEILKIAAIGIITAVSVVLLKETKPTMAIVTAIAGGVIILLIAVDIMTGIFDSINGIVAKTGLDTGLINIILKIIGVGYITEFASGICDEAGTKSTGDKITLGGKVIIMALSLPILISLIELIAGLLP